ncbi:MAG: LPS assembly protein LptD [Gammaproteobacteria bacterium]|nr:LPS assembly protein LptD [Gammaproteobacteria bacterium]
MSLLPTTSFADENWSLCRAPSYSFNTTRDDNQTRVEADRMQSEANNMLDFSGNVVLERFDFRLRAEHLSFDQNANSGVIDAAEFEIRDRHGRGRADKIELLDASRSRFDSIIYTSCDPGERYWHFSGKQLEIDDERGLGTAWHTVLYLHDVPFFYLPYFQFPIDDRRMSGMLAPGFSISDADNSHIAAPIYWNIVPNFDTTFTPAWYPERGLLYQSEHRYLFQHNRGQFDFAQLDDNVESQTRWFNKWRHNSNYKEQNLSGYLLLQEVSDKDYFSDFNSLMPGLDDIDHLDRQLLLSHSGEHWQSSLLWQNYQTVDNDIAISSRPYQRLPRLSIKSQYPALGNGLRFNINNELVHFERESSITGNRAHLLPTLSWDNSASWYFFKPQLQYALTQYELDNNNMGAGSIQRSLPIASIDSGLIFERTTGPGNSWLQTLEPRLYLVHIPYRDQNEIPDFDTALHGDSYTSFFTANRFSGADRIGDTDQLTFGLGSRIYDSDSGDQLAYARFAQVFYADDRLVNLGEAVQQQSRSNLIAHLDITPNTNLKIGATLIYQEEFEEFGERKLSINWTKNGIAANLEYYFEEKELEQSLISVVYPVNEKWTVFAKYHESQLFDMPVENIFGLNYESCCWSLKILASEVSDDDFIETENSLYFEFTLKGLTQAGDDIDSYLKTAIPGYQ